jgi:hypothetical protein
MGWLSLGIVPEPWRLIATAGNGDGWFLWVNPKEILKRCALGHRHCSSLCMREVQADDICPIRRKYMYILHELNPQDLLNHNTSRNVSKSSE